MSLTKKYIYIKLYQHRISCKEKLRLLFACGFICPFLKSVICSVLIKMREEKARSFSSLLLGSKNCLFTPISDSILGILTLWRRQA